MNRPYASTNDRTEGGRSQQPPFPQEDALDLAVTDVLCEAEGMGLGERVFFVAADDGDVTDEGPGVDFNVLADNVLAESSESVAEVIGEVAGKRPAIKPLAEEPLAEIPPEEEALAQAEAIAPAAEAEAEAVIAFAAEPVLAVAADSASGEYLPATPATPAAGSAAVAAQEVPPAAPPAKPENPRAQRNRERARRKKERRAAKAAARAGDLPEIILARSEGTDTLQPEGEGAISPAAEAPSAEVPPAEIPGLDAATLEAALLGPAGPELEANALDLAPAALAPAAVMAAPAAPAAPARPESPAPAVAARGPVRSLITPIDIIEDNSDILSSVAEEEKDEPAAPEADAEDDASLEEAATNNVILFRPAFLESQDSVDAQNSAESEEAFAPPRLRLLPPVEDNIAADEEACGEPAAAIAPFGTEQGLSESEKLTLLRSIVGGAEDDFANDAASDSAEAENVILFRPLYSEPVDQEAELARARAEITAALTAELTADMESQLQTRSDEFALRLLEAEAAAAESEGRARTAEAARLEKEKETTASAAEKEKEVAGLNEEKTRLAEELKTKDARLAASSEGIAARDARLRHFDGLQDEHEKLYAQFEDLRTAYNEIVTSAMPGLQAERDDFALTVERQVDEMSSIKSSLSGARRRLAVGYSMAAAAAIMVVSLPIAGWLDSGADERAAARDRQEVAELRERADEAERQTLAAGETIIELERKLNLAATELAKLESRDGELSRRGRAIAASASAALPGGGTPTRASTMALQATPGPGGELRVNEIRDPAGSIEQVYADNRSRRERTAEGGAQMASASSARPASAPSGRITVSAVARASSSGKPSAKPALASAADSLRPESAAARTASVRAGEGVAQVVYRVMGTRDPEVINWVIRENGIKSDRRGNPRIYPEQQLRLPGRMEQTASR